MKMEECWRWCKEERFGDSEDRRVWGTVKKGEGWGEWRQQRLGNKKELDLRCCSWGRLFWKFFFQNIGACKYSNML